MQRSGTESAAEYSGVSANVLALLEFEQQYGVPVLRSEGKLLALIKSEPGNPVKFYLNKSDLSPRWFYKILSMLTLSGLVREKSNPRDSRQKLLT